MSTPLRLVALLALVCAGPAAAQTAPAERAWTDPPARGAAPSAAHPASEPAQAAAKRPQADRTVAAAPRSRAEPRIARHTPKTRLAAEPRRVVTPTRLALRSAPPRRVHALRSSARPVRYGFIAPPPPPGGFHGDPRAQRIRQAEAAGYLVVRRGTVAAPDGRILYGYRPYESDDADD